MTHYKFKVRTIEDLREPNGKFPWENKREIKLLKKEVDGKKFYIAHYTVAFEETFDTKESRECRGIMFDEKGILVSRPFHKFFNVGENKYSREELLIGKKFDVFEKVDGALIIPEIIDGNLYFRTKRSFESEEALLTYKLINTLSQSEREEILDFIVKWKEKGYTPMFELAWTEKFPHVVVYEKPRLSFLFLRNNESGEYRRPSEIPSFINDVKYYGKMTLEESKELLEELNKGYEGVVLFNENIDFFKLKTQWYLTLHKAKENINIKSVVEMVLKEELDDFLSLLSAEGHKKLMEITLSLERQFRNEYERILNKAKKIYDSIYTEDRKEFFTRLNNVLKNERNSKLLRYYLISWYLGKTDREKEIKLWLEHFKNTT